jgi:hypothetical protein
MEAVGWGAVDFGVLAEGDPGRALNLARTW